MLVTIEALSEDNAAYTSEVKKLNYELFSLRESKLIGDITVPVQVTVAPADISVCHGQASGDIMLDPDVPTAVLMKRKPQLLIFGNKSNIVCAPLLFKKYLYGRFDIEILPIRQRSVV